MPSVIAGKPHIVAFDGEAVTVKCTGCARQTRVPITKPQLRAWADGGRIQRVAPYLNTDQRELLTSGTCVSCWDRMFSK